MSKYFKYVAFVHQISKPKKSKNKQSKKGEYNIEIYYTWKSYEKNIFKNTRGTNYYNNVCTSKCFCCNKIRIEGK